MTAQSQKTEQKWLHSCVLSPPKWPKIRKKLRHHARVAIKASHFVADTIARVENASENVQVRRKTTLLGKYRLTCCPKHIWERCDEKGHLRRIR